MNGKSGPLSNEDIIAARIRAAEGGVPWDRAEAVQKATVRAVETWRQRAETQAGLALTAETHAAKWRRAALTALWLAFLEMLALLWLLTRHA